MTNATFTNRAGNVSDGSAAGETYGADRYDCFLIEPTAQGADEQVWIEFTRISVRL